MISVDKFIGIKYALRYKAIVTHHRVCRVIAAGWITGLLHEVIAGIEHDKLSWFGSCLHKRDSFLTILFTPMIPIFLAFFITITLDAYVSIKAYQVYQRMQKESGEE